MGTDINFNKSLGRTYGTRIGLPAFDPAAAAYFTATGITGATQQQAINNLVKGLKQDGLWSKMKAVYPFVTDNRNLFSYTEDFGNAYWTNATTFVSVSTNSAIAPNGTLTADSINEDTTNNLHYVGVTTGFTLTAVPYTLSVYAKKVNRDWVDLSMYDGTTARHAWFNINTGTIGTVQSGVNASITNVGNGWYRCSMTMTMGVSNNFIGLGLANADNVSTYTGNGLTACYMWGAQLELGSTATTYQPIATTQQAYIASQFKYNLVNPVDSDAAFRLVFNGGWTHSANGATPNGTNGYANTYLVPNTSIPSINSAHISFYSRTNSDSACDIGAGTAIPTSAFQVWPKQSNLRYVRVFSNFIAESTTESTAAFYLNSRLNSTNVTGYRNGAVLTTLALNSVSTITNSIVISARSDGGIISNYSNRQAAFASIGDGLTDTEAANLYIRVQAFQTALSRQV